MFKHLKISLSTLLLVLGSLPLLAQTPTGTINGRIVDPQNAVVEGASITVTNESTNVAHKVQSNHDGLYTVPLLQPGTYSVAVTEPNFKQELRKGIVLQIGQTISLDFGLAVGATTDTISVTADQELTQTESAAVGTVIDNQKVVEIPLNGRQFYNLAVLVPGVVPPVQNSGLSFRGGFNVAGQLETANYTTLDGINNMDAGVSAPSLRPSIDDIEEFKIYTGTYEAEFGHAVGGQVVVTTKSGTNAYHGDLYEFIRNQLFDAKNYFTAPGFKPSLKRNQFGGTFGGPIKKDKVFFFFNYEGLRLRNQFTAKSTVPTAAQVGGNFAGSAPLVAPAGYDPRAVASNVINPQYLTPSQLQAYTIGKALLSYYPQTAAGGGSNYTFSALNRENSDQYALRLDGTINQKNTVYATLNYFNDPVTTPNNPLCAGALIPGFGCSVGLTTQLYGGGWTHIFTPNLINTARAGYQRLRQPRISLDANIPFDATYGIPAFYDPSVPNNGGVPYTNISGFATFGGPTNLPQDRGDSTYDYGDTVLLNKGAHAYKFGVEYTRTLANALIVNSGRGSFTFQGTYTGNPLADALLGLPSVATRAPTAPKYHARYTYIAGFAQDTWKVTRELTLNYGLRWETFTPITEENNQIETFNVVTGQVPVAGNGDPDHVYHAFNKAFGPRLGLSYRPFGTDDTVIQAGFGVTYDAPVVLNGFTGILTGYPLRLAQTFQGTQAAPLSFPNPFAGNGNPSLTPQGISPYFQPPVNIAYSFGVQQQLSRTAVATLSYQGSETAHNSNAININQSTAGAGNAARPYSAFSTVTYYEPISHATYEALYAKVEQRLKGGLTYLISYTWSKSIDDYNASPQDIYNLRAERGLSSFDVRNRFVASPVYRLPFGEGRRFLNHGVTSYLVGGWELAGNIAIQDGTPVTPTLASNLSTNGKTTGDRPFVQGNPNTGPKTLGQWFNVFDYNYANTVAPTAAAPCPTITQSTTAITTVTKAEPSSTPNCNPGTILPPGPLPYGNARRGSIASPAYRDVDLNIARTFPLPREMSLQFRAELFNVLNHPNFGLPGSTFTGFTTPVVNGVPTTTVASGSFGQITSALDGRDVQFALKLYF